MTKIPKCSWCGENVDIKFGYQVSDTHKKVLCDMCSKQVVLDDMISEICCYFDKPEIITSKAHVIEEDGLITKYEMTIKKVK